MIRLTASQAPSQRVHGISRRLPENRRPRLAEIIFQQSNGSGDRLAVSVGVHWLQLGRSMGSVPLINIRQQRRQQDGRRSAHSSRHCPRQSPEIIGQMLPRQTTTNRCASSFKTAATGH
jgi:hypothetical protein